MQLFLHKNNKLKLKMQNSDILYVKQVKRIFVQILYSYIYPSLPASSRGIVHAIPQLKNVKNVSETVC